MKNKLSLLYLGALAFILAIIGLIIKTQFGAKDWRETFQVEKYCQDENVAKVFYCKNGYLKVVSKLLGGGSTYIKPNGAKICCPVVAPDEVSEKCQQLDSLECSQVVCENNGYEQNNTMLNFHH